MASSQASYASRIAKAEQLFQHINSFTNYNPGVPELTPSNFKALITGLSGTQEQHTLKHHDYAESARERREIFTTNRDSISKRLTLANAYIRARKGIDSQQYIDVNKLIQKIKSTRSVKVTINATDETISRSERSYGSQLQNFTDIIALLKRYGTDYQPANTIIDVPTFLTLQEVATTLNNKVTLNYGAYKPQITERQNGFKTLSETATRIKQMVKAQYGSNSTEYNLVKVLRFH